jgi:hypothetical protein
VNDLPEIKNEPSVEMPRSDLDEFARGYRSASDRHARQDDEPRKSRFKYLPTLLAILVAIVAGWHWFATNHLEKQLTLHVGKYVREQMPDLSVTVDVHPLTNLVEIQVTRSIRGKEGAYDFLGDAFLEYLAQQVEPAIERELSELARKDTDLYAMMVPYQVSISMDKVRVPPAPAPSRMVQEIQSQLNARGYDAGPADGRLGQRTRSAIVRYQQDHGLSSDGLATGDLLDSLAKK